MRLLIDSNVLLDVLFKREPFVKSATLVLDDVVSGPHEGVAPFHSITTIHYLVAKDFGHNSAITAIDWIVDTFYTADASRATVFRARELAFPDFEDAVVAATAENELCEAIITRDKLGFASSKVPALKLEAYAVTYGR